MTTGKKLPVEGQLTRKDGDSAQREGAADKEQRHMQSTTSPAGSDCENAQGLDARLQKQLGHKLKAMFDEVANAPIPDKFLDLLSKLDGQEAGK